MMSITITRLPARHSLLPWVVAGALLLSGCVMAQEAPSIMLHLDKRMILHVLPDPPLDQQALEARWGQFEIRLRPQDFPLRAPHCRQNIILRMPGVAPDSADRADKLQQRWSLYQQVLGVRLGRVEAVALPIDTHRYVQRLRSGERILQFCNAFLDFAI